MKFRAAKTNHRRDELHESLTGFPTGSRTDGIVKMGTRPSERAFTMIEIALCLAIIGFALISILLVLPSGMNTQRDTRQETIIGQDASELLEAIRGGARGYDELTNYVYAIVNSWAEYNANGTINRTGVTTNTYNWASINIPSTTIGSDIPSMHLTNGLRIIGLLSTPEYTAGDAFSGGLPLADIFNRSYVSNHVVAYIRSFSGLAAEKPPQNNQIMQEDTFSYRLLCVNAAMAADTNMLKNPGYAWVLAGNLRELRLLFEWPELPNGNVGGFRQTFRATIAGQLITTNYGIPLGPPPYPLFPGIYPLYFYQSQSFTTNMP